MLNSVFMNLLGRESLIAADNTWGLLGVMCLAVAFSIFLEQKYKWASKCSATRFLRNSDRIIEKK